MKSAKFVRNQERVALDKYHKAFDNVLYVQATKDDVSPYKRRSNQLIDEALAISGSPSFKVTLIEWNSDEVAFLEKFA